MNKKDAEKKRVIPEALEDLADEGNDFHTKLLALIRIQEQRVIGLVSLNLYPALVGREIICLARLYNSMLSDIESSLSDEEFDKNDLKKIKIADLLADQKSRPHK